MRWVLLLIAAIGLVCFQTSPLRAHALEPGYLEISPLTDTTWRVFWSRPDVKGRAMDIEAVLPSDCSPRSGPEPVFNGSAWIASWVASCAEGMTGGTLEIDKLDLTRTDVLVRYELTPGAGRTHRLTADQTSVSLEGDPGWQDVLLTYIPLGVDHILGGIDHLLFVFALLLLISDGWRLVGAITAFTLAHSLTLAAATLGYISLPSAPVEAVIALSIMFLASELLHRHKGELRLSERYPWTISFSFGLLHGFGFAGALADIGLPQEDVPLALLSFNIGVEAGQLGFVAVVFAIGWVLHRTVPAFARAVVSPSTPVSTLMAYGIGGISAYWFFDRLTGFL